MGRPQLKRNNTIIGLAAIVFATAANAETWLRIKCEDEDAGAVVFVNDKEVGPCPVDAPTPAGKVVIRARLPVGSEQEKLFFTEINVIEGIPKRIDIVMSPPQLSAEAVRKRQAAEAQRDLLAAEAGDIRAMDRVAKHYTTGYGVEKDAAKAQEWRDKAEVIATKSFQRLADSGNTEAMKAMAERYEHGFGAPRDPAKAQEWRDKREVAITQSWLRAADNGKPEAMAILASRYEQGLGVPRDPVMAQEWRDKAEAATTQALQRAAGSGDIEAMRKLAERFENGLGVQADPAQAQTWGERYQQALQEKQNQRYRPAMVVIPAGKFEMGSNDSEYHKPVHGVTVPSFMMARTEVTQAQWRAVMGNNPSQFSGCEACPVEMVNWEDVQSYLRKLNAQMDEQYRLPSEAEWEYACRAGGAHAYCGNDDPEIVAWGESNSGNKTHPVAQKKANAFGLYDMSGNVFEWAQDCWNDSYSGFFQSAPTDGRAWMVGECEQRVLRGSAWMSVSSKVRATSRFREPSGARSSNVGFRLARTLP